MTVLLANSALAHSAALQRGEFQPVMQEWVCRLSFMQQSVLMSAVRGCDGIPKRHKCKAIVKWYRRCILISAFDNKALDDPIAPGGGSFTGPIGEPYAEFASHRVIDLSYQIESEYDYRCSLLQKVADDFMDSRDELPSHYQIHFMHACEIIGYKHPTMEIRDYWSEVYERLAKAYHLWPETEPEMDKRLGDNYEGWTARNDRSSSCSD